MNRLLGIWGILFVSTTAFGQNYQAQYLRSIEGVIANIKSNGAVVASPSTTEPNYYYDWVRDTSLTMRTIVKLAYDPTTSATRKQEYTTKIDRWIDWELHRQTVRTLTGLGEPRFYVSGDANNESWGRPQNDGPALRATTGIAIANQWIKEGLFGEVEARLYRAEIPARTLIKRDLEYIAHHWGETSFDLWEEERGMHFYTLLSQKVALAQGAELASKMGDGGAAKYYQEQAHAIEQYMGYFYDDHAKVVRYAVFKSEPLPHKKGDLDIAVILAANQTFDGKFHYNPDRILSTLKAITETFDKIYKINEIKKAKNGMPLGIAIGRYPDDKYSGTDFSDGNPWFLTTLSIAEFLCNYAKVKGSPVLTDTVKAQFNRAIYHMGEGGNFKEQFDRNYGFQRGASDLTWSYASYVTAYRACFNGK